MASLSSRCQDGPPSLFLTFKFLLTCQVLWVMKPFSITSDSVVLGHPCINPHLLLTKSCFLSLWQHTYGDLNGCHRGLSSYMITSRWWSCLLVIPEMWVNGFVALFSFVSSVPLILFYRFFSCGKANPVADALSGFQFQQFWLMAPLAE